MSYSQNLRTDTNLQTADNYFNNLYDQNVTTRFLNNKTTGRKTVIEGVANVGDVLTIVSTSNGDWKDPDVARWQASGGGGTMNDFTLQTTNPLKVDGVNSTVVNNADIVNLSLAPSPAVGTYANPASITVTNEGLVSNVVSGSAPVVPLSKNINVSSALSSTGNNSFYADNNTDLNIDIADQVNPVSGTWGDSTHVAEISINNKGIVTSVVNTPISYPSDINKSVTVSSNLTTTGDNVFNGPNSTNLNIDLADTPIVPNTYGSSTSVGALTIDQKGRVTAGANVPIGGITIATNAPITGGSTVFPNGNLSLSHATSGVTPNTYGSATSVPVFGVNSTGHITNVTNTPITFPTAINKSVTVSSNLVSTGDNVFNGPNATNLNLDLSNTGVVSAIYGNSTNTLQANIDSKGRVVSASNVPIAFPASSVTINTTTPIAGGGTGNTFNLTHANSSVIPGAYGNPLSGVVPIITADAKGHISAASQVALPGQGVQGDGVAITGGGSVFGVNPTITLSHANFGTAGTYGSNTTTNIITTNASGHITGITSTPIAFPADTSLNSITLRNWKAGTGSTVGASDNVVVGDSALSATVRTNIIGSGSSSPLGGGDNNIMGYQSTAFNTFSNIIGNGNTATANNTNILGSGITNSLANSTTIGSNISNHIVNSTGFYRSTSQYSCQATNLANVVYNVFPSTLTIAPANIDWNFTNGVGVASNSLLLNDANALFHVQAWVTINLTPISAAATQHQFQARLRYINDVAAAVTISSQSQFFYSTNLLSFSLAFNISGFIRTASTIGAGQFAFVDIFRNTSNVASVTCNNYRITMTRVA